MKTYKRDSEKDKLIKKQAIPAVLFLCVVLLLGVFVFRYLDERQNDRARLAEEASTEDDGIVKWNGKPYKEKQNTETYLFMGTDIRGDFADYLGYDTSKGIGQADFLKLLVIDKTKDTYASLTINRNTMADFLEYDEKTMEQTGEVIHAQICLAYAYGNDGKEVSCQNTMDAISELLDGQIIDGCLSLSLDSIPIINHKLGGVTVKVEDDFSNSCPSLIKGQTKKLTDEEAQHFCHDRENMVEDDSVENRMARQKAYLDAAQEQFFALSQGQETFALDLYDSLSDKMYSEISKKQFSKIAKAVLKNEYLGDYEIQGQVLYNEETGFSEFEADQDSIDEVVIQLFYEPVE